MISFKKKETLVQNIAYMGLMAAINVVFVLLTAFVPLLFLLIVFVLPLTSTIVALHCKKIYFPIYAFATIGLCMLVTIWKIDDTIFYVIPSIVSGFVFALLVEKEIPAPWIIIATSIIQFGFSLASIPLINLMFNRSIIETFATPFGLKDYAYLDYIVPLFVFFLSLVQSILSFIVINEEIKKFGFVLKEAKLSANPILIGLLSSLIMMVIFAFIYKPIAYVFLAISVYFTCLIIAGLLAKKAIWIYISIPVIALISFFLFALLYKNVPSPLGLLMIGIFSVLILIIGFIDNCLLKDKNKDTI